MQSNLMNLMKKAVLSLAAVAAAGLICVPAHVKAAENDDCIVLVYAEQEGMGKISSSYQNVPFTDSITVKQGEPILLNLEVYPNCTFNGWYKDGQCVSTQKSYSFNANGSMCIITAQFRQKSDYVEYTSRGFLQDISTTNWSNRTCRFEKGKEVKNVAVTIAMAAQGDACINAFNTVMEDYKLARTYNITFTKYYNKNLDKLDTPASLVFQVPQELQSPGRIFRMINVYKGQPAVLEDTDLNDATLTFETDCAGAYALVYKDVPMAGDELAPAVTVTSQTAPIQ